jgi:hypothetical protein
MFLPLCDPEVGGRHAFTELGEVAMMAHGSADSFVPGGTRQRRHWQPQPVEHTEAS